MIERRVSPGSLAASPASLADDAVGESSNIRPGAGKAFVKQAIKAGLLVIACDAVKLPVTAVVVFAYFLYVYRRYRPSTVDLLALWLVVSPLMGPFAVMELGGLPAVRFQWCYAVLLLVSLSRERVRSRFPSNGLDASIVLFCGVCLLSIANSIMYRNPFRTFLDAMLVPVGYYIVAKRCVSRPDFFPKLYLAAMVGICTFGVLGLYEVVTQRNILDYGEAELDVFRINGPMRMAEDYGICMNMLLVFCISMRRLVKAGLIGRGYRYVTYLVGTFAVFFTVTRGIWLSLTAGSVVLFARRKTALFLIVVPVLALFAWAVVDLVIPQLSGDIWEKRITNQKTINARLATYKSALLMFQDHPLLGVGFGAFGEVQERNPVYQTEYRGEPAVDTPHNYFLSVISETGIMGILAVSLVLIYTMRFSWRTIKGARSPSQRDYGEAMLAITVAYLVAGLGNDFTRNIDFVNKFFFVFLGAVSGLADQIRAGFVRATP